jgi:lipoprotein-anchoring transpeptidase ErfK/SrfK
MGGEMKKYLFAFLVLSTFFAASTSASARTTAGLSGYSPGTIVVKTHERRLYYVTSDGHSVRYPVGVGRAGMTWTGEAYIAEKRIRPAWSPPEMIKHENPRIADVIPSGSPHNPMGAAALVLDRGEYAIHGTNSPGSIGRFVSHGCIRMHNADIMELYARVGVGTRVVVLP